MPDRSYIDENDSARAELKDFIARLDEGSYQREVGSVWTIATCLCHLAFWDQRALFLIRAWQQTGRIENTPLGPQGVEATNQPVNAIARAVPGRAAAGLALESAAAVDSCVAALDDDFADQLVAARCERYLRRSLHRREHLRRMRLALGIDG